MYRIASFGDLLNSGGASSSINLPFFYAMNARGEGAYPNVIGKMIPLTWNAHGALSPGNAPRVGGYPMQPDSAYYVKDSRLQKYVTDAAASNPLDYDWGISSLDARNWAGYWDIESAWATRASQTVTDSSYGLLQSFSVHGQVGSYYLVDLLAAINCYGGTADVVAPLHPTTIQSIFKRSTVRGNKSIYMAMQYDNSYWVDTPVGMVLKTSRPIGPFVDNIVLPGGESVQRYGSDIWSANEVLSWADIASELYGFSTAAVEGVYDEAKTSGTPEIVISIDRPAAQYSNFSLYIYDLLAIAHVSSGGVIAQEGLVAGNTIKVPLRANLGLMFVAGSTTSSANNIIGSIKLVV